MEIWKDVVGYEKYYQVSSYGSIRRIKKNGSTRPLKLKPTKDGYKAVQLYIKNNAKTFSVHRLVAIAFIPNPLDRPEVDHLDGIKSNNYIDNLEWVTHQENQDRMYTTGLKYSRKFYSKNKLVKTIEKTIIFSFLFLSLYHG